MRGEHESDVLAQLAAMKEFERRKAQEKFDADEDSRFREALEKAHAKTGESVSEKKQQARERREIVSQVRGRVTVLVERISAALAKMKLRKEGRPSVAKEQIVPEIPRYLSYEGQQEQIRKRYEQLCGMGLLKKEEDLKNYQMEWRLEGYYGAKAQQYSAKTGQPFRDFSIPTEEEMAILDKEVSDTEMLALQQEEEAEWERTKEQRRIEEARERVMRQVREMDERISYTLKEYQQGVERHEHKQPYFYERARTSTENRTRYEQMREKELQDLERVQAIIAQQKLDDSDAKTLQEWMDTHREFGLAEMSDEEYYDLFQTVDSISITPICFVRTQWFQKATREERTARVFLKRSRTDISLEELLESGEENQ